MAGKGVRLLAVAATSTALLGITTAPAQAQPPRPEREATAALYVFDGGAGQEAVTIENQDWSMPEYATGRTDFHPGWSIHLSDELLGAGLPRRDFKAHAHQGDPQQTRAHAEGFVSIIDQNDVDVPFVVLKLVSPNVICEGFVNVPLTGPRLFVRKADGELHEADATKPAIAEGVTSAVSATETQRYETTVEVKPVTAPAQITQYGPFWKYFERPRVKASGNEIVLTQRNRDTGATKTYKVLAGAAAVAC